MEESTVSSGSGLRARSELKLAVTWSSGSTPWGSAPGSQCASPATRRIGIARLVPLPLRSARDAQPHVAQRVHGQGRALRAARLAEPLGAFLGGAREVDVAEVGAGRIDHQRQPDAGQAAL